MDERHNVRAKTIKLLKEDTKEELYYINFSNNFCIWQQAQAAKKKQCALSKIKPLCTKGHYQLSEKATYRIEKILANDVSDQGLIFRMYEELQYNKWTSQFESDISPREIIQMAKNHMQRSSLLGTWNLNHNEILLYTS